MTKAILLTVLVFGLAFQAQAQNGMLTRNTDYKSIAERALSQVRNSGAVDKFAPDTISSASMSKSQVMVNIDIDLAGVTGTETYSVAMHNLNLGFDLTDTVVLAVKPGEGTSGDDIVVVIIPEPPHSGQIIIVGEKPLKDGILPLKFVVSGNVAGGYKEPVKRENPYFVIHLDEQYVPKGGQATGDVTIRETRVDTKQNEQVVAVDGTMIYPNPTRNVLNVKAEGDVTALRILDMQGRHIKTYDVSQSSGTFAVDVASLPAGGYLLQVQSTEGYTMHTFLKAD